jgi:hypothetical protein
MSKISHNAWQNRYLEFSNIKKIKQWTDSGNPQGWMLLPRSPPRSLCGGVFRSILIPMEEKSPFPKPRIKKSPQKSPLIDANWHPRRPLHFITLSSWHQIQYDFFITFSANSILYYICILAPKQLLMDSHCCYYYGPKSHLTQGIILNK